jgi:hypothetical protein
MNRFRKYANRNPSLFKFLAFEHLFDYNKIMITLNFVLVEFPNGDLRVVK